MSYILVYGFRRFAACKKLGWTSIPCYLKNQDKTIKLSIEEIHVLEKNTRLETNDEAFNDLMRSIKENGLLQPIGVIEEHELTKEEFLTTNIIENVHREELSPIALSNAVNKLLDEGLTLSQIAIRLSQNKSRIRNLIEMTRTIGDELDKATFSLPGGKNRNGKIPYSILKAIGSMRIKGDEKKKLVEYTRHHELTAGDIYVIKKLTSSGMNVEEAIQKFDEFIVKTPLLVINREVLITKSYKNLSASVWLREMLKGEIEIDKDLFWFNDKKDEKDEQ